MQTVVDMRQLDEALGNKEVREERGGGGGVGFMAKGKEIIKN